MTDFKSQQIKHSIKTLLKKKGITYEAVAESLGCSVPTVKRILGPEELSLTRLLELCEIVEIDLTDLAELTKDNSIAEEKFTADQQQFLAKNPSYLSYLLRLYDGESPKQIAEKFKLTQRSTDKYLIALEKRDLIRVTGRQKVKPAYKRLPAFSDGPLGTLYFEAFIGGVAKFFIEVIKDGFRRKQAGLKTEDSKSKFNLNTVKITRASYEQWIVEQERVRREFDRLAEFDEKTRAPSELMTAVVSHSYTILPNDNPNLVILENMTGDITNL